ncbi:MULTISPECIES: hypothetical protein [Moorena]|uniref:Uncharacterized protein n=1 Tax=Moorena producens (strain JHB) TaxID=1454205 RepID=A0A1D9G5T4_MOOP1|nr:MULTISPECIES: hypothetical protein [Moorena]AOY82997.1 hypothetical protein BJP36_26860 [Moorena producens JHB]NEP36985.1 hypothetical protein [Moorena sp. SIO3B2]NEQ04866.1 hypothetical protein [Moorena sp. SIO4E2]
MTNNPGGISQFNTGSMGVGQQAATDGSSQNQQITSIQEPGSVGEQVTQQDMLQMLAQLDQMVSSAEIPAEIKEEVATYLSAARKAVEKEKPNKERVKINLEGVAEELKEASNDTEAGANLFKKVKPILGKVVDWLGAAAAGSLLGSL